MCGLRHGTCGIASYLLVPGLEILGGPVTKPVPVWDPHVRPPPKCEPNNPNRTRTLKGGGV